MAALYKTFRRALSTQDGDLLSNVFSPENPNMGSFAYSTNHAMVRQDIEYELSGISSLREERAFNTWTDTLVCLWKLAYTLERDEDSGMSWAKVYERQRDLVLAIVRGFTNGDWPYWVMPALFTTCRYLRLIAIKSDEQSQKPEKSSEHLEDTARHINRMFTLCISDRAPLDISRKWGTYHVINMLFKTYFKLNSIMLSKNILRALSASSGDMPPLESFPKSDVVTFKYYCGVIAFLEEDYAAAEDNLTTSLSLCKSDATRNQELILTYLIPTTLLTSHKLPTPALLSRYPRLESLFSPLCRAIKSGNLQAFDAALLEGESEFARRRIYLTLGRGRDVAMRNLFRKVYLIGNKKTRISVREFQIAMGCAGWPLNRNGSGDDNDQAEVDTVIQRPPASKVDIEVEEAECMLANMIYKGLMKGYISRERQMLVLSAKDAFPGTGV